MEEENQENLVKEFPDEGSRKRLRFLKLPKLPGLPGIGKLPKLRKKWLVILGVIFGLFLVFGLVLIVPFKKVLTDISSLQTSGKELMTGFKQKNLSQIKEANRRSKENLGQLTTDLKFFRWLGLVPVTRGYWQDSQYLLTCLITQSSLKRKD